MRLSYFHADGGNFGDDLNKVFWDHFWPQWAEVLPEHYLYGIGTLINDGMPVGVSKMVLGSGVGYGFLPHPDAISECEFIALRGPRSARALGQPEDVAVADPAILVGEMKQFCDLPKNLGPVFVPHVSNVDNYPWAKICSAAGIEYLSPQKSVDEVIARLGRASLVIAESMHAAIIADALRTPWHAFALAPKFYGFKWFDWADSLGIKLTIERPIWQKEEPFSAKPPLPFAERPEVQIYKSGHSRLRNFGDVLGADRLRKVFKSRMLANQLRELATRDGNLSSAKILESRKAELQYRFAEVFNR